MCEQHTEEKIEHAIGSVAEERKIEPDGGEITTMNEPLRNLMKDEIEEAKREAEEEIFKMMVRKFFAQGQSVDYIAEFIEVDVETVEKWLGETREAKETNKWKQ